MNELVKAVRKVENLYGSVATAPDEVVEELQIVAKPFYRGGHHQRKTNSRQRKVILLAALREMGTMELTADEILERVNSISELTSDGEYPMPINNLYMLLKKYGFKYKRRRRK
ncbi:hypothetical protein [Levilactobacillus angrenensis]|uniref:Uncharacterized protein n=1 Tax=Levilactobacillus angrenensis TaxID=2486020 RepID=A0ABW1UDV9_9LACO|nr:hypothetical protein [Levilactobacillus angrenensis]